MRCGGETRDENARLQIPELVAPLSDDSESVLVKGDDDEEATDGREMWSEWL